MAYIWRKLKTVLNAVRIRARACRASWCAPAIIFFSFFFYTLPAAATEPTPMETNSLIVAYQLLDDSWIQEVGALTNNFARIYKDSLSTNQPPSYGAYVVNGNSWSYTSFSQRDLWDYMYNHPYSNGQNAFRNYIETDDLGEYITVSRLITAASPGRIEGNNDGFLKMSVNDFTIVNNGKRLATLSTVQTEQEIETISNAFCNCDWTIVTNIFNCVYAISNTLDSVEYNTYHSMTNTEGILSAIYSNWQGQNISLADWTRYIWVYLTTNNSGKPLKDLLVDLNNSIVSNKIDVTTLTTNLWTVLGISYVPSSVSSYYSSLLVQEHDILNWVYDGFDMRDFLDTWTSSSNTIPTRNDWANKLSETLIFDSYLNFLNIGYLFPIFREEFNIITNKTQSIPYTVILPEVSSAQGNPDIFGALTNAYLTSYNQQSDKTWFDRVELLLAALVFQDNVNTNGNGNSWGLDSNSVSTGNIDTQFGNYQTGVTALQTSASNYRNSALGLLRNIQSKFSNVSNTGIEWNTGIDGNVYFGISTDSPFFTLLRTCSIICWSCGFLFAIVKLFIFIAPYIFKGFKLAFNIVSALVMR